MDLNRHTITPRAACKTPRGRADGLEQSGRFAPRVVLMALGLTVGLAAPALALDLPLFGKPERSGNRQTQGNGLLPPGRQAAEESDSREAGDAARAAQAMNGGGRVLSVDEANGGWRVKLLKDGNVRFVFVPN